MATISNNDLGQNLDRLVAEFVQAAQAMVLAAVAEGLAAKPTAPAKAASSTKSAGPLARAKSTRPGKGTKPGNSTRPSKRRTPAEVAELGERFYAVVGGLDIAVHEPDRVNARQPAPSLEQPIEHVGPSLAAAPHGDVRITQ